MAKVERGTCEKEQLIITIEVQSISLMPVCEPDYFAERSSGSSVKE